MTNVACDTCAHYQLPGNMMSDACLTCSRSILSNWMERAPEKPMGPSAKDTTGKPDYTLLPWGALLEVVKVREYGTRKYGDPENWRKVPRKEYVKALLRHVAKAIQGEELDPESGLSHWSHVACNALFIIETK